LGSLSSENIHTVQRYCTIQKLYWTAKIYDNLRPSLPTA